MTKKTNFRLKEEEEGQKINQGGGERERDRENTSNSHTKTTARKTSNDSKQQTAKHQNIKTS